MQFDNVILEKSQEIAMIKLNRPEAFNALDLGLGADLLRALEICTDDADTRVVILSGAGKAFCAGGDLSYFNKSSDLSDALRQLLKVFNLAIMTIRRMPKPVIAAINGPLGGGGMTLAAACDLRICASSAKFKQAYTSIGLVPDGAWTLLTPHLIGFGRAMELALLDPVFDAKQALDIGFVNKVVEDGDLEKVTYDTAVQLSQGPTESFATAKENLNHSMFGLLERQLELERSSMIRAGKSHDASEGITAFLEKRKPNFIGK